MWERQRGRETERQGGRDRETGRDRPRDREGETERQRAAQGRSGGTCSRRGLAVGPPTGQVSFGRLREGAGPLHRGSGRVPSPSAYAQRDLDADTIQRQGTALGRWLEGLSGWAPGEPPRPLALRPPPSSSPPSAPAPLPPFPHSQAPQAHQEHTGPRPAWSLSGEYGDF